MKHLLIIIALITLVSCSKEKQYGDVTFYNIDCHVINPTLYVDDIKVGIVRKVAQKPVCGDQVNLKIITKEFEVGEHSWLLDDGKGTYHKMYFTVTKGCQQLRVD